MIQAVPDIPECRSANKAGVAAFFDVSLPAVDQWLRRGCPYVQKGSKGVSWVFDLHDVARWRFGDHATESGPPDPDDLTPTDRRAWYESEQRRRDLQVRDSELLERKEVEPAIATAFATIAQSLRSMSDNVERTVSPPPEVIEAVERIVDETLNALADQLCALAPSVIETEEGE